MPLQGVAVQERHDSASSPLIECARRAAPRPRRRTEGPTWAAALRCLPSTGAKCARRRMLHLRPNWVNRGSPEFRENDYVRNVRLSEGLKQFPEV